MGLHGLLQGWLYLFSSVKKVPKNDARKYKKMGNSNTETAIRYRE
jgi:hypothetical protein